MTKIGPAVLLALAASTAAGTGEDRRAYRALLAAVEVRHGVSHRALVVVPLVLEEEVDPAPAPRHRTRGISWEPVGDERTETVRLTLAGGEEPPVILPAGLLLRGDGRERLLSRPVLLGPEDPVQVVARFCDARAEVELAVPSAGRRLGLLAPPEQRKLDLVHRDAAAMVDVQRIQALLAGLETDTPFVEDLLRAKELDERIIATLSAIGPVAGAYGDATCGHLAMLGHRPVELVLAATPASYRSMANGYLRGLALSLAIWEEYLGRTGIRPAGPDWAAVLPAARETFAACSRPEVALRRWRLGRREKGGGRTLLVQGPAPHRSRDDRSRLTGRLLMDAEGRALLLESYPSGGSRMFPSPLIEPGGRPTDDRPDVRSGALTKQFLQRLMARRASRH
jgi:hypothetical protein